MRHPEDWRSIFVVFLAAAFPVAAVTLPVPWIYYIAWLPLVSFLSFVACVVNHNHVHRATFRTEGWNLAFGCLLTIAKGHTSTTVLIPHNLNHHLHHGGEKDWIRVELGGQSELGARRFLTYVVQASCSMRRERGAPDAPGLPRRWRQRRKLEMAALALFSVALFFLNPLRFVFWVGLPWLLAMGFLVGINYLQHDGCDPESELKHSRDFTSPLGNWLLFNNGFHTVHHLRPQMHWTELPEAHERLVRPRRTPGLEESSLLRFFYQAMKERKRPKGNPSSAM